LFYINFSCYSADERGYGLSFYLGSEIALKSSFIPSIVLGGILSFVFYGAIHKGWLQHPFVVRYFASHPIEYVITTMFFVGLAILLVKYGTILTHRQQFRQSPILPPSRKPLPVSQAADDLDTVLKYEKKYGFSPLTERLKNLLHTLHLSGSSSNFSLEIRNRAEDAAAKADNDYGLVRLILWAVPMLGFLGTVIGITAALDNLDLNTISESSQKLSAGLALAFDTTGLAIALAVFLFFTQFLVQREETKLLAETDRLAERELYGRFEQNDPQKDDDALVTIRRMLESIAASMEQTAVRQTSIWEQCMTTADKRYAQLTKQSAETLKTSLASALHDSLGYHAKSLAQAESELLAQTNTTARQFTESISKGTAGLLALREETVRQTEAVRDVLGTNSQLLRLEERLHENLSVLAQIGNFEETVNSLAAAIHLLNSNRRSELRAG